MAIIFSEEDLKDIKPPCVIQNFINHNAVLYKVFVVGEAYTVVERPSIRNFPSGPAGEIGSASLPNSMTHYKALKISMYVVMCAKHVPKLALHSSHPTK